MGIISSIKAAYIRLCERNEAAADRMEAERLALVAARKEHKAFKDETARMAALAELKSTDAAITKADRLLKDKK